MPAVTTVAQVANLALGLIGQRDYLDGVTEDSAEAIAVATFFASARNELLSRYHWRFATKRVVLAIAADGNGDPQVRSGWGYCYAAPADMLVAQRIWDGQREPGEGERIAFGKELNDAGDGHLIVTDQANAELIYTVELATVALWPSLFVMAVAARLAVFLAGAIPSKSELMPGLQGAATQALLTAASRDFGEGQRDPPADSESIRVR